MDQWFEISVSAATPYLGVVEAVAVMLSPGGIYTEDYADMEQVCEQITGMRMIDEELLAKDRTHGVVHIYLEPKASIGEELAFLKERLDSEGFAYEITTGKVAESDWAEAWKQYYKPVRVGKHFVVVPCWEPYTPQPEDVILMLDPGMAFGTGTHESTQLCLGLLEGFVRSGDRMMDIGTGSGILSIGALLLGASEACAFDIDPISVKVSVENVALNHLQDRFKVAQGGLSGSYGGKFRVICANIVADVILALLPDIGQYLELDGVFIISGIIDFRGPDITAAAEKYGYKVLRMETKNNWIAFALSK